MSHEKKRVLEAFTKQAESYSNSSVLAAEQARIGFMIFVDPLSARAVQDWLFTLKESMSLSPTLLLG